MSNKKDISINNENRMTEQSIVKLCRKHQLYSTPQLNDVLYLHYQGYQKIECLEKYIGLKCLWLECNAIGEISGLDNQEELRCLYLQNNFIRKIENLGGCPKLDTLNLAHNHINFIENCDSSILPALNTLNLANNSLTSVESIELLINCKTLSILDLSNNRIDDIVIVKILSQMPELRVLTLMGNPVVNAIPSYRKTLITECKQLTYLDTRPVFDKDRACAEAWKRGGFDAEKKEREKWEKAERRKVLRSVRATIRLRNQNSHSNITERITSSSDEENDEKSNAVDGMENISKDKSNDESLNEVQHKWTVDSEMNPFEEHSTENLELNEEKCELLTGKSDAMSILHLVKTSEEKFVDEDETVTANPMIDISGDTNEEENLPKNDKKIEIISSFDEVKLKVNRFDDSTEIDAKNAQRYKIKFYCENLDSLRNMNIDCDDRNSNEIESDVESFTEETITITSMEK